MKTLPTFTAEINLGLQEGYDGKVHSIEEVYNICQEYCNEVGLGLTVTPTKFIYKDENENGCIIGLINYPRFPTSNHKVLEKAKELTMILMKELNQFRISIVCSDKTYMLEKEE